MDIQVLISNGLLDTLFPKESSYTLGVAISSLAIIVAFMQILSPRRGLKIRIYKKWENIALALARASVALALFAEFVAQPFYWQILAALLMFIAISLYIYLIQPLLKLRKRNLKNLRDALNSFLPNKYAQSDQDLMKEIVFIYDDLLRLSAQEECRNIFSHQLTSKIFLDFFSQSGYVFSRTLDFLLSNHNQDTSFFFEKLFLISLENKDSYLNVFLNEEIFPYTMDNFYNALLKHPYKVSRIISGLSFNLGHSLSEDGQLSFLRLVSKYFKLIYSQNQYDENHGTEPKYKINDELASAFFDATLNIFSSGYRKKSESYKKEILDLIVGVGGIFYEYQRCSGLQSKSKEIRKKSGEILYDIYEHFLIYYDIKNTNEFASDHFVGALYRAITHEGEDKIAQNVFIKKLKEKIVGEEEYASNVKGYYPAMILIYFRLFGLSIFSGNNAMKEDRSLHVRILSALADSLPRLYDGYAQEFYNAKILPKGKEMELQRRGAKTVESFLLDYMTYSREENSLSYYFQFGKSVNGAKIYLDKVRREKQIEVEEI